MCKKSLFLLFGLLLFFMFKCERPQPVSLADIELKLKSQNLSELEIKNQLANLRVYLEQAEPPNSVMKDFVTRSFLTPRDTLLLSDIQSFMTETSTQKKMAYFKQNMIFLYSFVTHVLNERIRWQHTLMSLDALHQFSRSAEWVVENISDLEMRKFLLSEIEFYDSLNAEQLKSKLELEFCYSKATKLLSSEIPQTAFPYIGKGLRLTKSLHDKKREVDFLTCAQYLLYEIHGFTSTALALGDFLLHESQAMEYPVRTAEVHYYNGNIFIDLGQFNAALEEYQKAKLIYDALNYRKKLIMIYERMGIVHRHLGQFDAAFASYERMFELDKKDDVSLARIRYLLGKGLVQVEQAQYSAADSLYRQSLQIALDLQDTTYQAITLADLGILYFELGNYAKAIENYLEALHKLESKSAPHIVSDILIDLTEAYVMNKDIKSAKVIADSARKSLAKTNYDLLKARSYLTVGKLQLQIGDLQQALQSFQDGLGIFQKIQELTSQMETLNLIGETQRRLKNYAKARQSLQEALTLGMDFPYTSERWISYFYLSRLSVDSGEIARAETYLMKSIEEVNTVASHLINAEQRLNFAQKIQPVFEEMVLLQLRKNDPQNAFLFAERERAQVFKILLQSHFGAESKSSPILASLNLNPPNAETESLTLASLQAGLPDSVLVVEYEVTDSCLVSWIIGQDRFHHQKVQISRSQIDSLVLEFRRCTDANKINTPQNFRTSFEQSVTLGKRFYEFLISPLAAYLNGARLLYLIPDETLHYLPFAALEKSDATYLIEDFAIATIPSAAILQNILQQTSVTKATVSNETKLLTVAADPNLKDATQEAKTVARFSSNSDSLFGQQATEPSLMDKLATPFQVILLAIHGKINEKDPRQSALILNKDKRFPDSQANDGQLELSEIMATNCDSADVVYLSACESASGRLYRGEGIIGMQRAFMIAGAKSVIANLWQVEDKSSKNIAVEFFKNWLTGKVNKSEALRQAQLDLISKLKKDSSYDFIPHPYLWAPVTLAGAYN